jgi:hypothetical protein
VCRSGLPNAQLIRWTSQIDAQYRALEAARVDGGLAASSRQLASEERFVPTASAYTLGAVLSDSSLRDLLERIAAGPAGAWIGDELGKSVACDLDQAWVRRQYAPRHYPPLHTPHGWHQDGALGFDFLSHPKGNFPPGASLSMVTCWIALGPCGVESPGLELVTQRLEGLLAPADLTEERVRTQFAPEQFCRPVMEAGDAVLFRGEILHRTHVTPEMAKDRTSIELRFFPAKNLPARLKADRFITLV